MHLNRHILGSRFMINQVYSMQKHFYKSMTIFYLMKAFCSSKPIFFLNWILHSVLKINYWAIINKKIINCRHLLSDLMTCFTFYAKDDKTNVALVVSMSCSSDNTISLLGDIYSALRRAPKGSLWWLTSYYEYFTNFFVSYVYFSLKISNRLVANLYVIIIIMG